MTPDPRPAYPRTPAYGEGVGPRDAADREDRDDDVRAPATSGEAVKPHGIGLSLGMAVGLNLVTLVGVLVLGWPAGNVFLLFWCENVVLGLVTLVRVLTAEAPDRASRRTDRTTTAPARASLGSRVGTGVFFCVHYGIFCAVHLVFTYLVASAVGLEVTWLLLGLPVVLVLVRYGVELATTWFGSAGLRARTSPGQAMGSPYPRIAVLHLAVLLSFFVGLAGLGTGLLGSPELPAWARGGVLPVALLLALKTAVDLATTRRALRPR